MEPNRPQAAVARRRPVGFTLIELLVVMSIIALFMFILVPTVTFMKKKAAVANTRARMMSLQMALNDYYTDFREYIRPDLLQYLWLGDGRSTPGKIVHFDRTLRPTERDRYLELDQLTIGTDGTRFWIQDYWGGEITYTVVPATTTAGQPYYQLISWGPDQENDTGGDDDIVVR